MVIHERDGIVWSVLKNGIIHDGTEIICRPGFARFMEPIMQCDVEERELYRSLSRTVVTLKTCAWTYMSLEVFDVVQEPPATVNQVSNHDALVWDS